MRVTYTHLNSKITKLDAPIAIGGRGFQEHREGYPFGAYFTYPVTLGPGGEVQVASERVFAGQPTPSYEGSVSSNLSLFGGNLVIYGLLEFVGGHKNMNYTESYQCRTVFGTCAAKYERDANGQPTEEAILKGQAGSGAQPYLFLYKADYAKLRQLSARLALPTNWAQRLGRDVGQPQRRGQQPAHPHELSRAPIRRSTARDARMRRSGSSSAPAFPRSSGSVSRWSTSANTGIRIGPPTTTIDLRGNAR